MFGSLGCLYSARSYEDCLKLWNTQPAPRTKGQKELWGSDARPLDNLKKWHYRIERPRHDDSPEPACFDVCLYRTVMARYHRPDADGKRVAEYGWHGSVTSTQFMWRVVGAQKLMSYENTDLKRRVVVPLTNGQLTAKLVFDSNRVLLTAESSHEQVYRKIVSPEMRMWRKEMRKELESFLMLMAMRLPTLLDTPYVRNSRWRHPGAPFAGDDFNHLCSLIYVPGSTPLEEVSEALIKTYDDGVEMIKAHADWAGDEPEITAQSARAAFLRRLDALCPRWIDRTEKDPLPFFAESLPHGWCQ